MSPANDDNLESYIQRVADELTDIMQEELNSSKKIETYIDGLRERGLQCVIKHSTSIQFIAEPGFTVPSYLGYLEKGNLDEMFSTHDRVWLQKMLKAHNAEIRNPDN